MSKNKTAGPYHGWIYCKVGSHHVVDRLARFALLNGLNAVDIVVRAKRYQETKDPFYEIWQEVLESNCLDPGDLTVDDAEQADLLNRSIVRDLQKKLDRKSRFGAVSQS